MASLSLDSANDDKLELRWRIVSGRCQVGLPSKVFCGMRSWHADLNVSASAGGNFTTSEASVVFGTFKVFLLMAGSLPASLRLTVFDRYLNQKDDADHAAGAGSA
ncbi:MAG TPA: hypothetical protein VNW90_07155 [Acetobacteraceae bacterium]|jgi:hypothetical protein|nr:hypothetical protein [Acetobacteraceae bacterium]